MRTVTCKQCFNENILTKGQKFEKCEYCGAVPEESNSSSKLIIGITLAASAVVIALAAWLIYFLTVVNVTVDGVRYKKSGEAYIVSSFTDELKGELELEGVIKGKPVKAIADEALYDAPITSVIIPGEIEKIGRMAFKDCDKLVSVTIQSGVKSIAEYAFYHCEALESVDVPEGISKIGASAFYGCKSLKQMVLPSSLTVLGATAFSSCASLESVTIGNGLTEIGYSVFDECTKLKSVNIPDSVARIGIKAFYRCSQLKVVTVGSGVTHIGKSAFEECVNLEKINCKKSENDWNDVEKGDNWRKGANEFTIVYDYVE